MKNFFFRYITAIAVLMSMASTSTVWASTDVSTNTLPWNGSTVLVNYQNSITITRNAFYNTGIANTDKIEIAYTRTDGCNQAYLKVAVNGVETQFNCDRTGIYNNSQYELSGDGTITLELDKSKFSSLTGSSSKGLKITGNNITITRVAIENSSVQIVDYISSAIWEGSKVLSSNNSSFVLKNSFLNSLIEGPISFDITYRTVNNQAGTITAKCNHCNEDAFKIVKNLSASRDADVSATFTMTLEQLMHIKENNNTDCISINGTNIIVKKMVITGQVITWTEQTDRWKSASAGPMITDPTYLSNANWYLVAYTLDNENYYYIYDNNGTLSVSTDRPLDNYVAYTWKPYLFAFDKKNSENGWLAYQCACPSTNWLNTETGNKLNLVGYYTGTSYRTTMHSIGNGFIFTGKNTAFSWGSTTISVVENFNIVSKSVTKDNCMNYGHWVLFPVTIHAGNAPTDLSGNSAGDKITIDKSKFSGIPAGSTLSIVYSSSGNGCSIKVSYDQNGSQELTSKSGIKDGETGSLDIELSQSVLDGIQTSGSLTVIKSSPINAQIFITPAEGVELDPETGETIADPTATLSASVIEVGQTSTLTVSTESNGVKSFSSFNSDVATVDANGVITGVSAGTATISYSVAATENYSSQSGSVSITVTNTSSGGGEQGGQQGEEEEGNAGEEANVTGSNSLDWTKADGVGHAYISRETFRDKDNAILTISYEATSDAKIKFARNPGDKSHLSLPEERYGYHDFNDEFTIVSGIQRCEEGVYLLQSGGPHEFSINLGKIWSEHLSYATDYNNEKAFIIMGQNVTIKTVTISDYNLEVPFVANPSFDGETEYYLYNVEAKAFAMGDNEYKTRASVNPTEGLKWRIKANENDLYSIEDYCTYSQSAGMGWKKLKVTSENNDIWIDYKNEDGECKQNSWKVSGINGSNIYFQISNNDVESGNKLLGAIAGTSSNRLYFGGGNVNATTWAFVAVADYDAYRNHLESLKSKETVGTNIVALAPFKSYESELKMGNGGAEKLSWRGANKYFGLFEERYSTTPFAGEAMTQTIEGLIPGLKYEITFNATASFTSGREFAGTTGSDLTMLFVNDGEKYIDVVDRGSVILSDSEHEYKVVGTVDSDGKLKYGLRNVKPGANWFVINVKSIVVTSKEVSQSNQTVPTVGSNVIAWDFANWETSTSCAEGTPLSIDRNPQRNMTYTCGDGDAIAAENEVKYIKMANATNYEQKKYIFKFKPESVKGRLNIHLSSAMTLLASGSNIQISLHEVESGTNVCYNTCDYTSVNKAIEGDSPIANGIYYDFLDPTKEYYIVMSQAMYIEKIIWVPEGCPTITDLDAAYDAEHNNAMLSIGVVSDATFQWYKCDDAYGTNSVAIGKATNSYYQVNAGFSGTQYYYCVAVKTTGEKTVSRVAAVNGHNHTANYPVFYTDYIFDEVNSRNVTRTYMYAPGHKIKYSVGNQNLDQSINATSSSETLGYVDVATNGSMVYANFEASNTCTTVGSQNVSKTVKVLTGNEMAVTHLGYNTDEISYPDVFAKIQDDLEEGSWVTNYSVDIWGQKVSGFMGKLSLKYITKDIQDLSFTAKELSCRLSHISGENGITCELYVNDSAEPIKYTIASSDFPNYKEGWANYVIDLSESNIVLHANQSLKVRFVNNSGNWVGLSNICLLGVHNDSRSFPKFDVSLNKENNKITKRDSVQLSISNIQNCSLSTLTVSSANENIAKVVKHNNTYYVKGAGYGSTEIIVEQAATSACHSRTVTLPVTVSASNDVVTELTTWKNTDADMKSNSGSYNHLHWITKDAGVATDTNGTKLSGLKVNSKTHIYFDLPETHNGGIVSVTFGPRKYSEYCSLAVNDSNIGFTQQGTDSTAVRQISCKIGPNISGIDIKKGNSGESIITSITWMPTPTSLGGTVNEGASGLTVTLDGEEMDNTTLESTPVWDSEWMNDEWSLYGKQVYEIWNCNHQKDNQEILINVPKEVVNNSADCFLRIRATRWNEAEDKEINMRLYRHNNSNVEYLTSDDNKVLPKYNETPLFLQCKLSDIPTNSDGSITIGLFIEAADGGAAVMSADLVKPDYKRSVSSNSWGTICLPYDVPKGALYGATFYRLEGGTLSGKVLTSISFTEVDHLVAGEPYAFLGDLNGDIFASYEEKSDPSITPKEVNGMIGTYDRFSFAEHGWSDSYYKFYAISQNKIRTVGKNTTGSPNRAFFDVDKIHDLEAAQDGSNADASRITLFTEDVNEETSAIESVASDDDKHDVYDIAGRICNEEAQGLFIKGKKIILVR